MGWGVHDYPGPPPEPDKVPICPVCGAETDTLIATKDFEIVGCSECIRHLDAWDYIDEMYRTCEVEDERI